jgi:murein DD-endopeptidase MepM/ murein hydrolase activator NlpD
MSFPEAAPQALTRRRFLSLAGAAGFALAVGSRRSFARGPGGPGGGGGGLINPYTGSIPLSSPLRAGTFSQPIQDNWHASREGALYAWSHRYAKTRRAHDGVDVIPTAGTSPTVYSPVAGTIAAVCFRETNSLDETPVYSVDGNGPPPWNYSLAADTVAGTPLYGNFVWIRSSDTASAGYHVFVCHLAADDATRSLVAGTVVTTDSPLGFVGDTGNAVGSPQLHVEIH